MYAIPIIRLTKDDLQTEDSKTGAFTVMKANVVRVKFVPEGTVVDTTAIPVVFVEKESLTPIDSRKIISLSDGEAIPVIEVKRENYPLASFTAMLVYVENNT